MYSSSAVISQLLIIGAQVLLYAVGSYIQVKIVSTCRRERDKTWKITITNSIVLMIFFFFAITFETITEHLPVLSQYTGDWICYLAAFVYTYGSYIIGFHSFVVSLMKYFIIVHYEKVTRFGEERFERVLFLTTMIHPLLLSIPTVLFYDFETFSAVTGCFGLKEKVLEQYNTSNGNMERMFLCKLNDGNNQDAISYVLYILKQCFCAVKLVWVLIFSCNIVEGFLYYKIFKKMRR